MSIPSTVDPVSLTRVDVLEALLDGPRALGAFLLRALLDPPWSMRIQDEAPLTVLAVLQGDAWLCPDGGAPIHLQSGELALVCGPDHYVVADSPATPPSIVVYPGGHCTSADDGRPLWDEWSLGIRTWGQNADQDAGSRCVMLIGTYAGKGQDSQPLLSALPAVVRLSRDEVKTPLLAVLAEEMKVEAAGQRALLDRLLDVILISTLRTWFAGQQGEAPGWFRAQHDPAVGQALSLLHYDVSHPWTVDELAARAGVSRSALARRFTAARLGRRSSDVLRCLGRDHRAPGRLRHPVLLQHRFQARARDEPAAIPISESERGGVARHGRDLCRASALIRGVFHPPWQLTTILPTNSSTADCSHP